MSEIEKNVVTHQEDSVADSRRNKKGRGCKNHCKRFWWAYLIVFVIIAVLVPVLIIFVGVPKLAQKKINESKLEIQSVQIRDTRTEGLRMEIESKITSSGGPSAKIRPFTADMYLEDKHPHKPFVRLEFPETTSKKEQTIKINQDVTIEDLEAFTTYNMWFSGNKSLTITVDGKTSVRPAGLLNDFDVDYKKTYDIDGLNKLEGVEIVESNLDLGADDDEPNFTGRVKLPNPSKFTLEVGNISFATYVDGQDIGVLNVTDVLLESGGSEADVRAILDFTTVLGLLGKKPYCETGKIPFTLEAQSVYNKGEFLPYFTKALGSNNQTIDMDVAKAVPGFSPSCDDDEDDDDN